MPKAKDIWDEGECLPDFDFWKRTAYWTIEEGVALTLGKEPRRFNSDTLANAPRDNPAVSSFFEWLELANRAISVAHLSDEPTPSVFLEWRAMTEIGGNSEVIKSGNPGDYHALLFLMENDNGNPFSFINYKESYLNLEAAYIAKCKRLTELEGIEWELNDLWGQIEAGEHDTKKPKNREGLDNRKRKSLLKIVLSTALTKYHFKPIKPKNSAPKNMETATLECGLHVTDETIRSLLREAVECFPEVLDLFEGE